MYKLIRRKYIYIILSFGTKVVNFNTKTHKVYMEQCAQAEQNVGINQSAGYWFCYSRRTSFAGEPLALYSLALKVPNITARNAAKNKTSPNTCTY